VTDKTGPTGRPLRADARRNRDLVLATAREMLSARGLSVSLDEIARHAGVGVGTVYRHFSTRNALFEAVILGRIEGFVERAKALADDGNPGKAFVDYFTHLVNQVSLNQALCDSLEGDAGMGFAAPESVQREFLQAFDTLLGRAQEVGKVRSGLDIGDVLDLAIGCATAERRARHRDASNRLLAVVLDGLCADESRR
jgi:AcrR family transcriptional regulator